MSVATFAGGLLLDLATSANDHANDIARILEFAGTVGVIVYTSAGLLIRRNPDIEQAVLDEFADQLAMELIRIETEQFNLLTVTNSLGPAPRFRVNSELGSLASIDINDYYRTLSAGRLVITAETRQESSLAALSFVVQLLEKRQSGDPVPFRLAPGTWNYEADKFEDWFTKEIATRSGLSIELIEELIKAQRIIPILDSCDYFSSADSAPSAASVAVSFINVYLAYFPDARLVASGSRELLDELAKQNCEINRAVRISWDSDALPANGSSEVGVSAEGDRQLERSHIREADRWLATLTKHLDHAGKNGGSSTDIEPRYLWHIAEKPASVIHSLLFGLILALVIFPLVNRSTALRPHSFGDWKTVFVFFLIAAALYLAVARKIDGYSNRALTFDVWRYRRDTNLRPKKVVTRRAFRAGGLEFALPLAFISGTDWNYRNFSWRDIKFDISVAIVMLGIHLLGLLLDRSTSRVHFPKIWPNVKNATAIVFGIIFLCVFAGSAIALSTASLFDLGQFLLQVLLGPDRSASNGIAFGIRDQHSLLGLRTLLVAAAGATLLILLDRQIRHGIAVVICWLRKDLPLRSARFFEECRRAGILYLTGNGYRFVDPTDNEIPENSGNFAQASETTAGKTDV